jgi:hypothetical protein
MGHHAQQAFLSVNPVDQGFVFLAENQELVFQLKFFLGAAAVQFRWPQAEAKSAHHPVLLPARHPAFELLEDVATRKHLFRCGLKLDQRWCDHQSV